MEDTEEKYKYEYKDTIYCLVVAKEKERFAAYPEQSTVNFENVANITVDSDSVIQHETKMGVRKIFSKTVGLLTKIMRQIRVLKKTGVKKLNKLRAKKEMVRNQFSYITHSKYYLKDPLVSSVDTMFGINNVSHISILMTDQRADTNCIRMEYLLF